MEYPFSINDIKSKTNVSLQSLYNLIKKNREFIDNNSTHKQRKIYYNQAAMDFFINYYNAEATPETPPTAEEHAEKELSVQLRIEALETERDALKAEINALKKQLETKEAERLELLHQNGALILTFQQLQKEKMLLLPPPKKSFSDKIKSFFKSKPQEK